MTRAGYLARLARQSGAFVGGVTAGEARPVRERAAPLGLEVDVEHVIVPAPATSLGVAAATSTLPPLAISPPLALVRPVPAAAMPETSPAPMSGARSQPTPAGASVLGLSPEPARPREPVEHPVVRVGEALPRPLTVPAPPTPAEIPEVSLVRVAPKPDTAQSPPESPGSWSSAPVRERTVIVADDRPSLARAPLPNRSPSASPSVPQQAVAPTTARVARTLAEARNWVSATPAPGEVTMSETAVVRANDSPLAPTELVVQRENTRSEAPVQELHVSIGKIDVVIDAPPAASTAPATRAQAQVTQAPSDRGMRPLWRHHLRA